MRGATNTLKSQIACETDSYKANQCNELGNHNVKDDNVTTEFSNGTNCNSINSAIILSRAKNSLLTDESGNYYHDIPFAGMFGNTYTKYYINNPSRLIETAVGSGGVEVINQSSHTVRLSISPSQMTNIYFTSEQPKKL